MTLVSKGTLVGRRRWPVDKLAWNLFLFIQVHLDQHFLVLTLCSVLQKANHVHPGNRNEKEGFYSAGWACFLGLSSPFFNAVEAVDMIAVGEKAKD